MRHACISGRSLPCTRTIVAAIVCSTQKGSASCYMFFSQGFIGIIRMIGSSWNDDDSFFTTYLIIADIVKVNEPFPAISEHVVEFILIGGKGFNGGSAFKTIFC